MYPEEYLVIRHLNRAWNSFLRLPVQHPDDNDEFRHSIHNLQRMIAVREVRRSNPDNWINCENPRDKHLLEDT